MPDYKGYTVFPGTNTITGDIFWAAFDPDYVMMSVNVFCKRFECHFNLNTGKLRYLLKIFLRV
jgi:hypothetical protein